MKATNFIAVIILFVYSALSFVGVGIFHCGCTNSRQLVLMAFHTTCPSCSNSGDSCCHHNDQHHHDEDDCDEDGCCMPEYKHIDIEYLNVEKYKDVQAKVLILFTLPVVGLISEIKESFVVIKNNSPPDRLLKIPLIYLHSQLRL